MEGRRTHLRKFNEPDFAELSEGIVDEGSKQRRKWEYRDSGDIGED